jgi:hypothetical protein
MKLTFLKVRTNSQLKRNRTQRDSISYQSANTVGILFTVEDKRKHEIVKELVRKLEVDGKKVFVMSFLPNKKDNYEFLFDFFSTHDINFWGNIQSTPLIKFAETQFDYLLCLDTQPNPMVQNILARSKAKCRVGKFNTNGKSYFEMMIDTPSNPKNLIDGIYDYTSKPR